MKFQVMSRQKARKHSFREDIKKCVIVSINDKADVRNNFHNNSNIKAICSLFFDDVEGDEPNCMTRDDADKIIGFVNQYINDTNDIEEIIVHCGAGVSRSAGVCAALMLILTGDDSDIFNNPKFCPNMHCYRLVLESYFGYYDKEAADEKLRRNIVLWRKVQGLDD